MCRCANEMGFDCNQFWLFFAAPKHDLMNSWLLVPLIGAVVGWLVMSAGLWLFFKYVLPKRKPAIDRQISRLAAEHFVSFNEIEAKLTSPASFQKLSPVIESHIDEFLRHKLGKSMPFLSAFIGDKTINQLKGVFMEELADLFPTVMKNYFGQLQQEIDLEGVLLAKLAEIPAQRIESTVQSTLAKELRLMKMMGAVTGFMTGLVQLIIASLIA
jgi:uncharacterized membrane protein YheB (UPF0754 family)